MWRQIHRLLGVPEPVLDDLQQLRSRVAELEQQVLQLQSKAVGSLPGGSGEGAQG